MRLANAFGRRSGTEWSIRAALMLAVALAGAFGVAHSAAIALRARNPVTAFAFAPRDGRTAAAMAASLSGLNASMADRQRADDLARRALLHDPTAVAAVSTLGLNAGMRGDTKAARALFAYAEKLSRRDVQAQLWAIEDAVGRGDIRGALKHYDTALRTSLKMQDVLFPVLGSAISDPAVRAAMVDTLASKPIWWDPFVAYAAVSGEDPRAVAGLFNGLGSRGLAVPDDATRAVIDRLIKGGFPDQAWAYFSTLRRGVDRRHSRDPRFTASGTAPTPFDWTALSEGGVSTSIQSDRAGGLFDFAAPPSVGGDLLQQTQLLPPGKYRLAGHSQALDQAEADLPYWSLRCPDGRELGRIVVPSSAKNNGHFEGMFEVPAHCSIQTLVLVARPTGAVSGLSGQITQVELVPAGEGGLD